MTEEKCKFKGLCGESNCFMNLNRYCCKLDPITEKQDCEKCLSQTKCLTLNPTNTLIEESKKLHVPKLYYEISDVKLPKFIPTVEINSLKVITKQIEILNKVEYPWILINGLRYFSESYKKPLSIRNRYKNIKEKLGFKGKIILGLNIKDHQCKKFYSNWINLIPEIVENFDAITGLDMDVYSWYPAYVLGQTFLNIENENEELIHYLTHTHLKLIPFLTPSFCYMDWQISYLKQFKTCAVNLSQFPYIQNMEDYEKAIMGNAYQALQYLHQTGTAVFTIGAMKKFEFTDFRSSRSWYHRKRPQETFYKLQTLLNDTYKRRKIDVRSMKLVNFNKEQIKKKEKGQNE